MITTYHNISFGTQTVPEQIPVVQGDTGREIVFILTDFTIPEGATATYYVQKPSGEAVYNTATISENNIIVPLTAQSIIEVGENDMQVRVILGEDIVTSFRAILMVRPFLGIGAVESSTEMNIFDKAAEKAAEDFQEQAEAIVEEVIESIPADYTELTDEVTALKADFNQISEDVKTYSPDSTKMLDSFIDETTVDGSCFYYKSGALLGISGQSGIVRHSIPLSTAPNKLYIKYTNLSGITGVAAGMPLMITVGNSAGDSISKAVNMEHLQDDTLAYLHFNETTSELRIDVDTIKTTYSSATYILMNLLPDDKLQDLVYYNTKSVDKRLKDLEIVNDDIIDSNLTNICNNVDLSFELGGLNTNTGEEGSATNRARSALFYAPVSMRIASVDDEYVFRVLKFTKDGTFISTLNNSSVSEYTVDGGYSYRILIFPSTLTDLTTHIADITNALFCFAVKRTFTVSKDGHGDFSDVQTCLDYLPKTSDSAYTILVYPGVYEKICTMTLKKYVDSPTNEGLKTAWRRRKLNIIGMSPTNCIIQSDTGEYMTPAAEISIIGEVRNMCFISTHTSPPEDRTEDESYLNHKAYAVHSDYDTSDELYTNCIGISYQAPAWGIGGAQDKKIRLVNCRAYNYSDASGEYAVMKNYGGIYYHLANSANKTGQVFELKDCYVYNQNGDKALWVQIPSNASEWSQETHMYNNIFWGDECTNTVTIGSTLLSADSYGNNAPNANAE